MRSSANFKAIADLALQVLPTLLKRWLPHGKRRGHEYLACNPTRADSRPGSFSINLTTGQWGDFATDAKGGDAISLCAYLRGLSQVEAAHQLADELRAGDTAFGDTASVKQGAQPAQAKEQQPARWRVLLPVPPDAPPPPAAHIKRGLPEKRFIYHDAKGAILGYVCRFRTSDGGKEVLPLTFVENIKTRAREWRWLSFPIPRPLYGLQRLAEKPQAPVLIVEGEPCADAALLLERYVPVTWPGGARAIEKVDWEPLRGCDVIVWPDADAQRQRLTHAERDAKVDPESKAYLPLREQPGIAAAQRIAEILLQLDCQVRLVNVAPPGEKKPGWDIADAIAEGWGMRECYQFIMRNVRAPSDPPAGEAAFSGRPLIDCDGGLLAANVDKIEAILAEGARDVYQRAGELVLVTTAAAANLTNDNPAARGVQRDPEAPVIVRLGADCVRVEIGRLADFRCMKAKGPVPVDCPKDYAAALVGLGAWPTIRRLAGVVSAPLLRPDGTIAQSPGYDPVTGLLIQIAPDWPPIPDAPNEAQARAALAELLDPFREFPFAGEEARAAFASAILSRLVILILPTCPAYFLIAPEAEAGKTLLEDSISMIGGGVIAAKRAFPDGDEPEMRKLLTASLLAGDTMIAFDNVRRGTLVGSAVLDGALTSGVWSDRVLGTNKDVSLPFRTLVMFGGNNIGPWGDTVRRGIYCRLRARAEQAEGREYAIPDLLDYLRAHRRRLVVAGLTVMRGYIAAGRPCAIKPLATYEMWSRLVREPLVWLDMLDPVLTQRAMRAADDDRTDLGELLAVLERVFGQEWFVAADVHARCYPDIPPGDQALRTAMRCDEVKHVSAKAMGRRLGKHAGRPSGMRQIETRVNEVRNCLEYRVCVI